MGLRRYRHEDLEALHRLHAKQGFSYEFPDVDDLIFLEKLVLENEDGEIEAAALLRLTSEAYLLHDPEAGTAEGRMRAILELHEAMRLCAKARGLEDVYVWIPPEVTPATPLPEKKPARGFEKRLERLGWRSNRWRCWWRNLKPTRE